MPTPMGHLIDKIAEKNQPKNINKMQSVRNVGSTNGW
jgi:hypothetical protein